MRILLALTLFAAACGGTKPKKESALVNEGSDQTPTCCCKTIPQVGEKEIVPVYDMKPRMECSQANGDCVDDVQCNSQGSDQQAQPTGTGGPGEPPPPPVLQPSTSSTP
ncbi:MAG TPA: hypothetical protein VIV40_00420 [Kofleriaceae bacterium]